jgi:hypothetical protein
VGGLQENSFGEIPMQTKRRLLLLFLAFSFAATALPCTGQQVILKVPGRERQATPPINPGTKTTFKRPVPSGVPNPHYGGTPLNRDLAVKTRTRTSYQIYASWVLSNGNWSNQGGWSGQCGCIPNNNDTYTFVVNNDLNFNILNEDLSGIGIDYYVDSVATQLYVLNAASLYLMNGLTVIGGVIVDQGILTALNDLQGHEGTIAINGGGYLGTSSTGHFLNLSEVDNNLGTIFNGGVFVNNNGGAGPTSILKNYTYYAGQDLGGIVNYGWFRNGGILNNTSSEFCGGFCAEINNNSGGEFDIGFANGTPGTLNNNANSIFFNNNNAVLNNYSVLNNNANSTFNNSSGAVIDNIAGGVINNAGALFDASSGESVGAPGFLEIRETQ